MVYPFEPLWFRNNNKNPKQLRCFTKSLSPVSFKELLFNKVKKRSEIYFWKKIKLLKVAERVVNAKKMFKDRNWNLTFV